MGHKLTHSPLGHANPENRPSQTIREARPKGGDTQVSTEFPCILGKFRPDNSLMAKIFSLVTVMSLTSLSAMATGLRVIEVRPGFPLHNQHTPVTDYYLSGGKNQGLKVGQKVALYRYTSVTDPKNQQDKMQMKVPVGQVEIIYVEDKLSVARLKSVSSEAQSPRLELPSIALGDWAEGF